MPSFIHLPDSSWNFLSSSFFLATSANISRHFFTLRLDHPQDLVLRQGLRRSRCNHFWQHDRASNGVAHVVKVDVLVQQ
eukprot:4117276-Amphidinium_carterae.2